MGRTVSRTLASSTSCLISDFLVASEGSCPVFKALDRTLETYIRSSHFCYLPSCVTLNKLFNVFRSQFLIFTKKPSTNQQKKPNPKTQQTKIKSQTLMFSYIFMYTACCCSLHICNCTNTIFPWISRCYCNQINNLTVFCKCALHSVV